MKNETCCWLVLLGVFFFLLFNSLAKATWWWMLYRALRKVPGTTKVRLWEKTCALLLEDVPLLLSFLLWCSHDRRKNTRIGTSMTHRRLTIAGIEVAPHYHQLLVTTRQFEGYATKFATTCCGPFVTVSPAHEALKDDQNVACWQKKWWNMTRLIKFNNRFLQRDQDCLPFCCLWRFIGYQLDYRPSQRWLGR